MTNLRQAVDDAARAVREWVCLTKAQRVWLANNHQDALDVWPCPTVAAVHVWWDRLDKLLSAAKDAEEQLELWKWAAEAGCYTQKNSMLGLPPWDCRDIDGDLLATGDTPEEAIRRARQVVERMREGQE